LVVDKNGKKMSKSKGNGTDPEEPINKFGVDALRYWFATAPIGTNMPYIEDEVKRGSKLLTKLWNVARFTLGNLEDFDPAGEMPAISSRPIEDRWVLFELNKTVAEVRKNLDRYDTVNARAAIDTFFWDVLCDQYIEFIKDRFWSPEKYGAESKIAAQWTLWTVLRAIIGLYAPFIPFLTEELWQKVYQPYEGGKTLHLTDYPSVMPEYDTDVADMQYAIDTVHAVRGLRTERKIGNGAKLETLTVSREVPESLYELIKSAARANSIVAGDTVDFVVAPAEAK
jgi:valyl-tRNA synthetase